MRAQLAAAAALVAAQVAAADIINVPGDQPTIALALSVAAPGDEVVLAPGTYDISAGLIFSSSGVTLRSSTGDPATTTLDCNGGENVVSISGKTGIAITGLTITDGDEPLSIFSSEVVIKNCNVVANTSFDNFGALFAVASDVLLSECVFEDNTQSTPTAGAAVGVFGGVMSVERCRFTNNTAPQGAIINEISQGSAIIAGAGSSGSDPLETSVLVITDSLFEGNVADNGGAISALGADVTIDRCAFHNNTGTFGGAYFGRDFPLPDGVSPGLLTVTNSVFSGNDAPRFMGFNGIGAALAFSQLTRLTAVNNTFYANTAEVGRTIHLSGDTTGSIDNNIFAETADPPFNSGPVTDTNNLVTASASGAGFVDADGADSTPGTSDDDLRLAPASPAIDAGANFALPSGLVLDFGLLDRFVDDPSTPDTGIGDVLPVIDIGAHEFQPGAGPCNGADLAEPYGTLDFSDVVAFLTAFSTMGASADLAPPAGVFDFSDVVAFLGLFSAGCP